MTKMGRELRLLRKISMAFFIMLIWQNSIRCDQSQNHKTEGQTAKKKRQIVNMEGQSVKMEGQNAQFMVLDVSPVPILAATVSMPATLSSVGSSSPKLPPLMDNTVTTESVPTLASSLSSVSMWNAAWMQLPGLISVPRMDWAALEPPPTVGALFTLPTLFPAAAFSTFDNSNNNNNNFIVSPFSPTALLAKRDNQRQHQRETAALGGKEFGEDKSAANNDTETAAQFVGIRARFNPPIFEETARLFFNVFNHEAQHVQIRPQKQCFAEGCFHLHTFRISSFQRPSALTLKPLGPNVLLLNILSFDVDIESLLNGSVQLLITSVPITGNFFVSARQLSITALFDLQKDQHKVPYLRIVTCELRGGMISTKVTNMGLLNEPINLKYKTEMLDKAKELITSTICETISDTIRERVNLVLRQLPRAISVAKIAKAFASDDVDDCSSAPVALQLDAPPSTQTQRFYSNQLTLSYSNDQRRNGRDVRRGHYWRRRAQQWRKRRRRSGLEVIDFDTDKKPLSDTKAADKSNEARNNQNKTAQQKDGASMNGVRFGGGELGKNAKEYLGNDSAKSNISLTAECPTIYASLLDFLDLNSLGQVFVELDFLDSSAGSDFFAVGLSGNVFVHSPQSTALFGGTMAAPDLFQFGSSSIPHQKNKPEDEDKSLLRDAVELEASDQQKHHNDGNNNGKKQAQIMPMLHFPGVGMNGYQRKPLEMIFSDLSANLALLQAFRAKLLKIRLGPNSSLFGQMLRTTCGPDEVCLSDSIPEMGEKYPDKQLEIEIEPTQAPHIKFSNDLVTLNIIGTATFLLSQNGQTIGRIPFSTTVHLSVQNGGTTINGTDTLAHNKMGVTLDIPSLDLRNDGIDFFGLPLSTLESFLNTVRTAIMNSVGKVLSSGISLEGLQGRLSSYGIKRPGIQLMDNGLVLLNAELDPNVLLFSAV